MTTLRQSVFVGWLLGLLAGGLYGYALAAVDPLLAGGGAVAAGLAFYWFGSLQPALVRNSWGGLEVGPDRGPEFYVVSSADGPAIPPPEAGGKIARFEPPPPAALHGVLGLTTDFHGEPAGREQRGPRVEAPKRE